MVYIYSWRGSTLYNYVKMPGTKSEGDDGVFGNQSPAHINRSTRSPSTLCVLAMYIHLQTVCYTYAYRRSAKWDCHWEAVFGCRPL